MYNNALVSGNQRHEEASPAAIGATAGISVVFIVIAVVLMLLYLRSKQKQLHRKLDDLSDTFLHDSTMSESSYSYSYYTYEYTYSDVVNEDSYTRNYTDNSYYTDIHRVTRTSMVIIFLMMMMGIKHIEVRKKKFFFMIICFLIV